MSVQAENRNVIVYGRQSVMMCLLLHVKSITPDHRIEGSTGGDLVGALHYSIGGVCVCVYRH